MKFFFLLILAVAPWLGWAESLPESIAPTSTRLTLAQASPSSAPAISSEAAATQPKIPERLPVPTPERKNPQLSPAPSTAGSEAIDPLLDPSRPRNSQLTVETEQTLRCGSTEVVLPTGVYKQILLAENPEGRRATDTAGLPRQQVGLGYIRYQSDEKLKVGGELRVGGIDVGVRPKDKLPVRIWYKKMTQPDDITKAFTFILPPVGLIAGAGAVSSGNTLIPDPPPQFTEARDYFLREPSREEPSIHPAFRTRPAESNTEPGMRSNR